MDKNYWEEYYKKNAAPTNPSKFAEFCLPKFQKGEVLLEIGCGNGRDSIFFGKNEINVIAIDQSEEEIKKLQSLKYPNVTFKAADMVYDKEIYIPNFTDYVYSRFTLHAIGEKEQLMVMRNVYDSLKKGGLFLIEVRSTNDNIFGKGKKVEKNAYIYEGHYRRFIDFNELKEIAKDHNFSIEYAIEGKDLAQYKDSNPTVIRMILKK